MAGYQDRGRDQGGYQDNYGRGDGYDGYDQGGYDDRQYNDKGYDDYNRGGYGGQEAQQHPRQPEARPYDAKAGQAFLLPQQVKDFVFDLHDAMRRSRDVEELANLYNVKFPALSDAYFKQGSWPEAEVIASECGNDQLFLTFYNEMRWRHLFTGPKILLQDRILAWENYCRLFDYLLNCKDTEFVTTANWAFDIIHEFVYQFQSFCQYRTQLDKRQPEEKELLQQSTDAWAVQNVIWYLHGLIKASNIVPILETKRNPRAGVSAPTAPSQLHQMVGYFCIVGMSRLQCLLADYSECLQALTPLDVTDRNELFATNLLAMTSLYLHMGMSFLMLRRYRDAIRAFTDVLVHIQRATKVGHLPPAAADQVPKLADKILALLAIASHFSPGLRIDDQIAQMLKDKQHSQMAKMQKGDEGAFKELFNWASPKFIVASIPDYSRSTNTSNDVFDQQLRLFMEEVRQQLTVPTVRSYLKLYTTINLDKMARFNEMDPDAFRAALVSMKHKSTQVEWGASNEVGPLEGKPTLGMEFNYFVEDDTIVVDEQQKEQRYEKFFMDQINKFGDTIQEVRQVKL